MHDAIMTFFSRGEDSLILDFKSPMLSKNVVHYFYVKTFIYKGHLYLTLTVVTSQFGNMAPQTGKNMGNL